MSEPSYPVCKSYVYHTGRCWFVSTINRESSASMGYGMRYEETMVWTYDEEKKERGDCIVWQGEGPSAHTKAVFSLMHTGCVPEEDEG